MDRREAMKAAGAMASAIATIPPAVTTQWREQLDGPPSYDPVALLEAMAETDEHGHWRYSFAVEVETAHGSYPKKWAARLFRDIQGWPIVVAHDRFPDFTSAVRWLHQQAADADPAFAEKWPVPE